LSSIHPIGHEICRKMLIRYFPGILCGFTRDADLKSADLSGRWLTDQKDYSRVFYLISR